MAQLRPKDFQKALMKSGRINFAVTPEEKAEIHAAARKFGLTVTDYLLRLHRLARDKSRKSKVGNSA